MEKPIELIADDKSHVTAVTFTQDNRYLLNSGFDTTIKIWSYGDWKIQRILKGHTSCANTLELILGDSMLLSCSSDNTVRFWDFESGVEIKAYEAHKRPVINLRVAPDRSLFATSSYDDSIKLWSIPDAQEMGQIKGKKREIGHIVFSRDSASIITGGMSSDITVWAVPECALIRNIVAHEAGVAAILPFRTSEALLTVGFDGEIKIWELPQWQSSTVVKLDLKGYIYAALSPNDNVLAVCGPHASHFYSTETGDRIETAKVKPESLSSPTFSSNGKYFAVAGADRRLRIWSTNGIAHMT